MRTNTPLSALPWFTLNPAWVEQSAAFSDPDPRLAGAYIRVLLAAWRGTPAATIPASHRYLGQITGLDDGLVADRFATLTEGFVLLPDGRLHHEQMEQLALKLLDRYGKDIEEHALAAAMALQDPERFQLVATETARSTTRSRRSLPKGFGYSMFPGLRDWCVTHGYPTTEDQDWVMETFMDYSLARNDLAKDWESQFKVWATKELSYGRLPPSRRPGGQGGLELARPHTGGSVFSSMVLSKGEDARQSNAAAFGLSAMVRPREGGR